MKKLLLSLGTVAAVVAPVASVVSCGTETREDIIKQGKKIAGYDKMSAEDKKTFDDDNAKHSLKELKAALKLMKEMYA